MTRNNDRHDHWRDKAAENTDKWGVQPPADVVLAIMEELAEVAEEIIENSEVSRERPSVDERKLMHYIIEIAVLGDEIREELEARYEDDHGRPIPQDERPEILGDIHESEPIHEEIDDLAPLVYQLADSVDEYSDW